MNMTSREAALLELVRIERERWNDLRHYALHTGDTELMARMDRASADYAERCRIGNNEMERVLRNRLLGWVQHHLIRNYDDQHLVSHNEAVVQLLALINGRKMPVFFDAVAGELHPWEEPCDQYSGDGRSNICSRCDWRDVDHILHDSEWECDECGGPSPETSTSGCDFCGAQGDIVPRGQAHIRTWRPQV